MAKECNTGLPTPTAFFNHQEGISEGLPAQTGEIHDGWGNTVLEDEAFIVPDTQFESTRQAVAGQLAKVIAPSVLDQQK